MVESLVKMGQKDDVYSIVLVSSLARNILDDLQTLVAQLEGDLGEKVIL